MMSATQIPLRVLLYRYIDGTKEFPYLVVEAKEMRVAEISETQKDKV